MKKLTGTLMTTRGTKIRFKTVVSDRNARKWAKTMRKSFKTSDRIDYTSGYRRANDGRVTSISYRIEEA